MNIGKQLLMARKRIAVTGATGARIDNPSPRTFCPKCGGSHGAGRAEPLTPAAILDSVIGRFTP
jgi:hypothetical protein